MRGYESRHDSICGKSAMASRPKPRETVDEVDDSERGSSFRP